MAVMPYYELDIANRHKGLYSKALPDYLWQPHVEWQKMFSQYINAHTQQETTQMQTLDNMTAKELRDLAERATNAANAQEWEKKKQEEREREQERLKKEEARKRNIIDGGFYKFDRTTNEVWCGWRSKWNHRSVIELIQEMIDNPHSGDVANLLKLVEAARVQGMKER